MIGATEIEKSLSWFKLGLDCRMQEESHEFAEELATQSKGSFVLQINVAILTLVRAVATIASLGDVSKTRGLICSRKTRSGIGDSRGAWGGIARFSCLPKDAIHGPECGALHWLQKTETGDGLTWYWGWAGGSVVGCGQAWNSRRKNRWRGGTDGGGGWGLRSLLVSLVSVLASGPATVVAAIITRWCSGCLLEQEGWRFSGDKEMGWGKGGKQSVAA